jgi:hypothetical protein
VLHNAQPFKRWMCVDYRIDVEEEEEMANQIEERASLG